MNSRDLILDQIYRHRHREWRKREDSFTSFISYDAVNGDVNSVVYVKGALVDLYDCRASKDTVCSLFETYLFFINEIFFLNT